MNRNFFTFFSVFLCFYIHVNAQQIDPYIEMVTVDSVSREITILWKFTNGVDSITIYKCTNGCTVENNFTRVDKVIQSDLMWQDKAGNQAIPNYYCIGWEYSGKSPPHSNMVLEATPSEDGCNNAVLLSWNPYINMSDSLDHYKIFYQEQDKDTAFVLLDSIKGKHITGLYFDPANKIRFNKRLAGNATYRFFIQAVNKTNSILPISNIVEYTTQNEVDTLVPITIEKVTVKEDTYIQIDVITDPFSTPFNYLYLLRDKPKSEPLTPEELSFSVIDRIDSNGYVPFNQYRFEDKSADPFSGLYYYMVVAEHKCKASDTSNILTNIYLHGRRVEKYKDSIFFAQRGFNEFNPQEPYTLVRIVSEKPYEQTKPITENLTIRNCNYYVDVLDFKKEGVTPKYRIESNDYCFSNTLTIGHEPVIEFPNAFYPQSRDVENMTFYPIINFPSDDNYLFLIYNRWGQEVYRTTQPPIYEEYKNNQGRWDGTFNGKDSPAGIYGFKISFSYNEGTERYTESGSFMLVR